MILEKFVLIWVIIDLTNPSNRLVASLPSVHAKSIAEKEMSTSKSIRRHREAVGLHFGHYYFCRVHETLRVTPAMEKNIIDHVWSVAELIETAMAYPEVTPVEPPPEPPQERPRLRLIQGGRA